MFKRELSDVQTGFRKGWGSRDQTANIHRIIEKAREFQKNIYFCIIDYTKDFNCESQQTGKFLKRWEYQTTLPYAFWEICMQIKKQQLDQTRNNRLVLSSQSYGFSSSHVQMWELDNKKG